MSAVILRAGEDLLAAFAAEVRGSLAARRAFGKRLDAAADVLILGDVSGPGPDRTVAAAFLLAVTERLIVVPIAGDRQHPVNLARSISTLSSLHGRRAGLAASDAGLLSLVSHLWESWPLTSIVGDAEAGVYVDDARILRISHPGYPAIGGPLTLPTDVVDKPVTVALGPGADPPPDVDVVLDLTHVGELDPSLPPLTGSRAAAGGARAVLGLGPSTPVAHGTRAFDGAGRLDQV
ncbi:hypothetical protein ACTU3I_07170 [Microbacterium sp. RD1]|uniref:hypothetical protein n=1 Tax=Microbacterium sp. RD1 TaxID=3457313 RepID=UPI003FA593CD